ncbi:MAG: ATP-dependent DNA helicase [Akkermansiaceae bacterium]|nr:ATP-dependent DNA helicase [Armatimonadota bacterium]
MPILTADPPAQTTDHPPRAASQRLPRLETLLGANGPLAHALPGFAHRPQQVDLAKAVAASLREGRPCLAEAGTGTGKTLAYLVPIALWLAKHGGRAVISTHTLALQSQLIERDIPALFAALPELDLHAATLKGRSNFVCLQDLEGAANDIWAFGDPIFAKLQRWANETDSGDVAELDFTFPQWSEVAANQDTCRGRECRFYDRCFYFKARKYAENCQLLVVNHALFMADLRLKQANPNGPTLIPKYDAVVFDEAHHVDDIATKAFGLEWGSRRVPQLVNRTKKLAGDGLIDPNSLAALDALNQSLLDPFLIAGKSEDFTDDLLREEADRADFRERRDEMCEGLNTLAKDLIAAADKTKDAATKERATGLARTATRVSTELQLVSESRADEDAFRWYQTRRLKGGMAVAQLVKTPLEVAPMLQSALLDEVPRVIFTSATLASGGNFDYVKKRLGLVARSVPSPPSPSEGRGGRSEVATSSGGRSDAASGPLPLPSEGEGGRGGEGYSAEPPVELIVGSPFDYGKNCLLYIPRHLGPPSSAHEYTEQVAKEIVSLVELAGGRTFALFTSHRMLHAVHEAIWDKTDYPIFAQGEMPPARLTDEFKKAGNGILLGTASFWEGVDVPGDALSLVIMDKLPFATPDAPTERARERAIKEAGGNAFGEYSLPRAQIRLKQGFGRLLRTVTDRGVVAILDSRLYTKSYGRDFLRDLPPSPRTDNIESVARFFGGG